jgi:sigma-B regulation protein RsbU (phosphoserine phosphatase)
MFVTLFVAIMDIDKGELKFCNAGHNPPIIIKGKKDAGYFPITKAIPVGLFESFDYQEEVIQIDIGDQIFLYTDGLTEAEDIHQILFGDDRLLKVVHRNSEYPPKQLIQNTAAEVNRHVNGHTQSDDLTMLSIIYLGKNEKE